MEYLTVEQHDLLTELFKEYFDVPVTTESREILRKLAKDKYIKEFYIFPNGLLDTIYFETPTSPNGIPIYIN